MKVWKRSFAVILAVLILFVSPAVPVHGAAGQIPPSTGAVLQVGTMVLVSGGTVVLTQGEFEGGTFFYNAEDNCLQLSDYGCNLTVDKLGGAIRCQGMGDFTIELEGENRIRGNEGIYAAKDAWEMPVSLKIRGEGTLLCDGGGIEKEDGYGIYVEGRLIFEQAKVAAQGSGWGIRCGGGLSLTQRAFVKGIGKHAGVLCGLEDLQVENSTLIGIATGSKLAVGINAEGGRLNVLGSSEVVGSTVYKGSENQGLQVKNPINGESEVQIDQRLMAYGGISGAAAGKIGIDKISAGYHYIRILPKNTFTPLEAPWLNVTWLSDNQRRLSFSHISNQNGYEIYRKTGSDGEWERIQTLEADQQFCIDSELEPELAYYYRVRGFKYRGAVKVYGPWSRIVK